mmetsp:Transcript_35241/g.51775  ORF Transcript_35241/g.51775 Transcript_35241/m.51775 type:complete len:339 (+) Transcript_35241:78-1094(+)|eukprot:CAMPEP_0195507220 /NCGR_PEP_ID=MMETSP0794_2-20130614/715_1 /TAXON_ID=515487 /ORGANISM="Stephanopyxis turris, Strain CCMP 815" /LENGTH=338 /DNA_ID=CAMNT_0040633829 /DNA_START=65 /DNA_END=1081 /DNA_ORIENTATION=-
MGNNEIVSSLRSTNWQGSIPIVVNLAQTSLSSPSMPPPLHKLVSRQTYLHVGLTDVIHRLSKFAVATPSDCTWFEDEDTGAALRWHLFAGVLFDLKRKDSGSSSSSGNNTKLLPWKIRLHFTSYPINQILQLDKGVDTVKHFYFNSLKQAMFLEHGTAKVSNSSLTKHANMQLWDAILRCKYDLYQEINRDLQAKNPSTDESSSSQGDTNSGFLHHIPVRLLVDGKPPIQRLCRTFNRVNGKSEEDSKEDESQEKPITLGNLLLDWLPHLFQNHLPDDSLTSTTDSSSGGSSENYKNSRSCCCLVQGIVPPLSCTILELWQYLCHPDHFLYIVVLSTS